MAIPAAEGAGTRSDGENTDLARGVGPLLSDLLTSGSPEVFIHRRASTRRSYKTHFGRHF